MTAALRWTLTAAVAAWVVVGLGTALLISAAINGAGRALGPKVVGV